MHAPQDIIYSTPLPRSNSTPTISSFQMPIPLIVLEDTDAVENQRQARIAAEQRRDQLAFLNKRAWARRVAQWTQESAPSSPTEEEGFPAEPYLIYSSSMSCSPPHTPTKSRSRVCSFPSLPRNPGHPNGPPPPQPTPQSPVQYISRRPSLSQLSGPISPPLSLSSESSEWDSGSSDFSASPPPSEAKPLPFPSTSPSTTTVPVLILPPSTPRGERRLRLVPSLSFISEAYEEESVFTDRKSKRWSTL